MIKGSIIGDIIGSSYEFKNIYLKDEPLFNLNSRFTDDTVMTVAICEILYLGLDPVETFHQYFWEYPDAGYGKDFGKWCMDKSRKPYNSYANGALMRISPCSLINDSLEFCIDEAIRLTRITHDHQDAIDVVENYIKVLFKIKEMKRNKKDYNFILKEIPDLVEIQFDGFGDFNDITLENVRKSHISFDLHSQKTYLCALISFLNATGENGDQMFESAIKNGLSLGGDTDTIGNIIGALCEMTFGIPDYLWEKSLQLLPDRFVEIIDEFYDYYGFD